MAGLTDTILLAAFVLRVMDLNNDANHYRLKSFQVLSFVAPLIWYVYFPFYRELGCSADSGNVG